MKSTCRLLALVLVVGLAADLAMGDGMIVPVRPDIQLRGHWAVKYHHVEVKVRNQVAFVSIDQQFVNTGPGMIEVEYIFPVPPDAMIDSMTLKVDGKEFSARLLKADEARKVYEDIVRRKKDPALLEYAGFGLYRTRAFPLEPGKPVRILVNYKNICHKDRNLVEVWYPLNTEKYSAQPIEDVRVAVDIEAGVDITTVYSPTHEIDIKHYTPTSVIATYQAANVLPVTDFQLFYETGEKAVAATLLTFQPDTQGHGYFMMLVSPSPRTQSAQAIAKDIVIVLDRSGSMSEDNKLTQASQAARFILKNLNPDDRFSVITYNDAVSCLFKELVPVTESDITKAVETLDIIQASGGTDIYGALQAAMKMLPRSAGKDAASPRPAYIIFLTDGLPTAGKTTAEKDILADTASANAAGARLFAFGVGYNVNVRLLDKLVEQNHGRSEYVKPKEDIEAKISSLYTRIKNPMMTNLSVEISGLELSDMYPRDLGDLFEGDQIVVVGRYKETAGSDISDIKLYPAGGRSAQLIVRGSYLGENRSFEYPVGINQPGEDIRFSFVEKLWAVRRVGYLLDQIQLQGESQELTDEVIRLSREYGIVTPYTSFLADETVHLNEPATLRREAGVAMKQLAQHDQAAGQMNAANRQALNYSLQVPVSSPLGGVKMLGTMDKEAYERGDAGQSVENIRQIGRTTLYRRGQTWLTQRTAQLDLEKQKDQIIPINRFSDEYFALVRSNTVEQNQVISSQRAGEELVIEIRGQLYRIK